jgi:hypothetical protein
MALHMCPSYNVRLIYPIIEIVGALEVSMK